MADTANPYAQWAPQAQPTNPYELIAASPPPSSAGHEANVATGDLTTDIPRALGTMGINLASGLAAIPNAAAKGIDWLTGRAAELTGMPRSEGVGAEAALSSLRNPVNPDYPIFPDYNQARNGFFGGTGAVEYVPTTTLGRRAMDAGTGAMLGLVTGGPGAILPTAAGAATQGEAQELFPRHPLAAALVGFPFGAWPASLLQSVPQRAAATIAKTGANEPYAAFERQGLPTELGGTVTGAKPLQWAQNFAARMPGSESAVGDAFSRLQDAWQSRLDQIAGRLGTASTAQEAGTSLQNAAKDWLSNFKANTGKLWSDFYSKVPSDTPVHVGGYQQALSDVLGDFAGAPQTGQVLQPGTVQSLSKALGVDLQGGNTLPWQAVKSIRTAIGEKLESPSIVSDTNQAALKRLYAGLTADMEGGAANVGPDALAAFRAASGATKAGHDLLESSIGTVLNAPTPEAATTYALGGARSGGTRLSALTTNLPGASGDLGAYTLRSMSGASPETPLAPATANPTALATALMGRKPVLSPEAQKALFPDAQTQADIRDMAATGEAMKPAVKDLANSPTATHEARGVGRVVTALELGRLGHEVGGNWGRAIGAGLGFMAPNIIGRTAQMTALNPYLSALYGRSIPLEASYPSVLTRAMMGPTLGPQGLPPEYLPNSSTFQSSAPQ